MLQLVVGLLALPMLAQSPFSRPPRQLQADPAAVFAHQTNDEMSYARIPIEPKRLRALNELRRKSLVSDANRLLLLAQELNEKGESMSPAEQLRKAVEIQKLAKDVKEKMTFAVSDESRPQSPYDAWPR